jgi:DNA polymerase-3 subunit alpha
LFAVVAEEAGMVEELPLSQKPWTHTELLANEKATLGFYITGHPLGDYVGLLQSFKAAKSIELAGLVSGSRICIGGIISDLQPRTTTKGDKFALLRLEDEAGGTKCVLWPETYRKYSAMLQNESPVLITGRLELSEDNPPSVIADQVQSLDDILKNRELIVFEVPVTEDQEGLLDSILHLINTNPGSCDVTLETIIDADTLVRVKVNSALRVTRSPRLESALKQLGCTVRIETLVETGKRV